MSTYLFVLCPPYSGSTVLWKLLSTSENVSALPSEGQFLPELRDVMREAPWQADHPLPWDEIKTAWDAHWDAAKPILLEKSPPNLVRALEIAKHFQPLKFIVMVRNPYAQSEGLMRRNNWTVNRAGNFSMMCLRRQLQNARQLEGAHVMTYESLVADPAKASTELTAFMPDLGTLDTHASFEVHSIDGTVSRPITDLNARKIAALEPDTFAALNNIFEQHRDVIEAWDYKLLDTSRGTP